MRIKPFRPILLLVVLLCSGANLLADSRDFYLEHAYFLGYTYKPGTWHRVYARIINTTDRDIEADVVLVVPTGTTRNTRYVYRALFPARSKRQVWFDVVPSQASEFTIELIRLDGGRATKYSTISRPLQKKSRRVTNPGEQKKQAQQKKGQGKGKNQAKGKAKGQAKNYTPPPQPAEEDDETGAVAGNRFLVLKVDEEDFLPTSRQSLLYMGSVRDMGGVYCQIRDIPGKWASFDGFDAMMVGQSLLDDYRPRQLNAIREWVASGGSFLVFPGNDWDAVVRSSLNRVLPVKLIGQRMMNRIVLDGKYGNYQIPLNKYVRLWEAELLDGDVLFRDGDYPMVVRKRLGLGQIIFCAFPGVMMNKWDRHKREEFWSDILRKDERVNYYRETEVEKAGGEILSRLAGAKVVSRMFVVTTLGIYLVAAAALLLLFRLRGRMELAWIFLLPLGIGLGVISLQTGKKYRRNLGNSLTNISVISMDAEDPSGTMGSLFGVHLLKTGIVSIVANDHNSFVTSGPATEKVGGKMSVDEIRTGRIYLVEKEQILGGSLPTFRLDAYSRLDKPVEADLTFSDKGLTGQIVNRTKYDLVNCLIVSNYYAAPIGTIRGGETFKVALSGAQLNPKLNFTSKKIEGSGDQLRTEVARMMFRPATGMTVQSWRDRIFLTGWARGTDVPVTLESQPPLKFEKQSTSLFMVRLLPHPPATGTPVRISRQFFCLTAPLMSIFNLNRDEGGFKFPGMGDFVVRAYPSRHVRDIKLKTIEMNLRLNAWQYLIDIKARDCKTGEYVSVLILDGVDGAKTAKIENAERFYDPKVGCISFRLDSQMTQRAKAEQAKREFSVSGWELREFSIEADAEAL